MSEFVHCPSLEQLQQLTYNPANAKHKKTIVYGVGVWYHDYSKTEDFEMDEDLKYLQQMYIIIHIKNHRVSEQQWEEIVQTTQETFGISKGEHPHIAQLFFCCRHYFEGLTSARVAAAAAVLEQKEAHSLATLAEAASVVPTTPSPSPSSSPSLPTIKRGRDGLSESAEARAPKRPVVVIDLTDYTAPVRPPPLPVGFVIDLTDD